MKLNTDVLISWFTILLSLQSSCTFNATNTLQIGIVDNAETEETQISKNKTIDNIVREQTDLIKKIISHHKNNTFDYPIVTKKEVEGVNTEKDFLHIKCQQLLKQSLEINKTSNTNEKPFRPSIKPEFLQKPIITEESIKTNGPNQQPSQIYDVNETNRNLPRVTSVQEQEELSNIKYVQLEPIILQKTVLSNGKTIFYWHKNLPTIPNQNSQSPQSIPVSNIPIFSSQTQFTSTSPIQKYSLNTQKILPSITDNLNYQTNPTIPNYEIEYGLTKNPDDNVYKKQMKFIIPVPYPSNEQTDTVRHLWQFDPYAYYPRAIQPKIVNVALPYIPNFHMIQTLKIPENIAKQSDAKLK